MIEQWWMTGALVALALLVLTLLALLQRDRRRVREELAAARAAAEELRTRVDHLGADRAEAGHRADRPPVEYLITDAGVTEPVTGDGSGSGVGATVPAHLDRIDGRLFADILLRESLVRAAAVAGGVRRALAPETRNRIRFEMRREVRRSRKHRRAELREARRLLHAQQRVRLDAEAEEDAA